MYNLHVILHPTDFSRNSQHALKVACRLARRNKARLILLHVAPPLPNDWAGSSLSLLQSYKGRCELETALRRLKCEGLQPERLLRTGTPAPVIVRVAKELNADLIVMGQPQPGWLRWLIDERVAETVARTAPCAVLVAAKHNAKVEAQSDGAPSYSENKGRLDRQPQFAAGDRGWRS